MSDKPKYRMPVNPATGKRIKMTEAQIMSHINPPEWMQGGGTVSTGYWYEMLAAREWVKMHGEPVDIKPLEYICL